MQIGNMNIITEYAVFERNRNPLYILASHPGLLAPAFVAYSTKASPALVLQATNAGVRRPGYEATYIIRIVIDYYCVRM